jgi:hypothetical protein
MLNQGYIVVILETEEKAGSRGYAMLSSIAWYPASSINARLPFVIIRVKLFEDCNHKNFQ